MCVQTDLHIKLVFWSGIISLVVLLIVAIAGCVDSFQSKDVFSAYEGFLGDYNEVLCLVVIVLSIVVVIISITTIVSMLVDWYPLLVVHGFVLIVLSLVMIGIGLWLVCESRELNKRNGLLLRTVDSLETLLDQPDNLSFNNTLLDPLQRSMECCGIYDWKDYWRSLTKLWVADILPIPKSCCIVPESNCLPNTDEHRQDGCLSKLVVYTTTTFNTYGVVIFCMAISVFIDAGFVFILAKRAKEFYYFYPYYM